MADESSDLVFLQQAVRGFLTSRGDDHSLTSLAELDWLGLLVSEELSGSGWRPVECTVIAEELARAHDRSPWLGTVLAAAAIAGAREDLRERWLPSLLKGVVAGGFALAGPAVRVVEGDSIGVLVVADRRGLRAVEAADVQARRRDPGSLDTTRACWCLDIASSASVVIGDEARATQLVSVAKVLISADAVGAVAQARERLVGYLRERIAFGEPLASFQAIQHRLVELLVFEVKARAILAKAAGALAGDGPAAAIAATAHAFVATHATAAVDECMQLSGGIGFTWEYPLHHELRRAAADAWMYGTARTSHAQLAGAWGW